MLYADLQKALRFLWQVVDIQGCTGPTSTGSATPVSMIDYLSGLNISSQSISRKDDRIDDLVNR